MEDNIPTLTQQQLQLPRGKNKITKDCRLAVAEDGDTMLVVWRGGASSEQQEIAWLLVRWRLGSAVAAGEAEGLARWLINVGGEPMSWAAWELREKRMLLENWDTFVNDENVNFIYIYIYILILVFNFFTVQTTSFSKVQVKWLF